MTSIYFFTCILFRYVHCMRTRKWRTHRDVAVVVLFHRRTENANDRPPRAIQKQNTTITTQKLLVLTNYFQLSFRFFVHSFNIISLYFITLSISMWIFGNNFVSTYAEKMRERNEKINSVNMLGDLIIIIVWFFVLYVCFHTNRAFPLIE